MQTETVDGWLEELASQNPTPGGGAAAAMNAAVGAALVSMVCNLTIGRPRYAQYEPELTAALAEAEELRRQALGLAAEDAAAFETVIAAYQLPKDDDAEKQVRTAAIQEALLGATDVPLRIAALAAAVIGLTRRILAGANSNVISDVAVAASSARAALEAAVVNVEVNLASMTDPQRHSAVRARLAPYPAATAEADAVVAEVRERIAR